MSTQIKCLLIVLVLACSLSTAFSLQCAEELKITTQEKILNNFKDNTKELYKVWHFIFNKDYDYNTVQGVNKYKTFKANLKAMNEHNAKTSSYKKGLNHLSDMTDQEVTAFYNIKEVSISLLRRSLRSLRSFNLDDYNDEDTNDIDPTKQKSDIDPTKQKSVKSFAPFDYRAAMRPIRNQKNCGSCWAFAVQATLEGCYNLEHTVKLTDWFSTQQSVDCDARNHGCQGGWPSIAMKYFENSKLMYEAQYPYDASRHTTCSYSDLENSGTTLDGFSEFNSSRDAVASFEEMAAKGPVTVAVGVTSDWYRYSSGVFDGDCPTHVNHAVVLVGLAAAGRCSPQHWIVRNSWGATWGEEGNIRILVNPENYGSCGLEKFAFQPTGFNVRGTK
jgi:C1A family cysteine protease